MQSDLFFVLLSTHFFIEIRDEQVPKKKQHKCSLLKRVKGSYLHTVTYAFPICLVVTLPLIPQGSLLKVNVLTQPHGQPKVGLMCALRVLRDRLNAGRQGICQSNGS